MFKWVAGLCAAIYVTLLVFGAPPEKGESVAVAETNVVPTEVPEPAPEKTPVVLAAVEVPTAPILVQEPEEVAPAASLVPPVVESASLGDDTPQSEPEPELQLAAVEAEAPLSPAPTVEALPEPTAESTDGVGEIWTVTGSRVNLRTDPNTTAFVLGQTTRGDSAEVIELLDNGWARVYIIDLGIEAYMSADFITRGG